MIIIIIFINIKDIICINILKNIDIYIGHTFQWECGSISQFFHPLLLLMLLSPSAADIAGTGTKLGTPRTDQIYTVRVGILINNNNNNNMKYFLYSTILF